MWSVNSRGLHNVAVNCAVLLVLTITSTARSEIWEHRFQGVVSSTSTELVSIGAPVEFVYTFDSNTPDMTPDLSESGNYRTREIFALVESEVAPFESIWFCEQGVLAVTNSPFFDELSVTGSPCEVVGGPSEASVSLNLIDSSALALESKELPLLIDMDDWDPGFYNFLNTDIVEIGHTPISVQTTPLPEPNGAGTAAAASLALYLTSRLRRNSRPAGVPHRT